ncbi:cAMP-activated global transcriptional regulator CRP [Methylocaldum sp.]|jgi:CRP/FNR family cyclic AMP-dependent transcriptional regulator|uniref:cAMP-activated global transcriptional regulator CRP n=1 Tax=Methylocaldum sp. TaxID=1969727 RepID=UPI002D2C3551|nr:cAMP-activated global transcriptional regulator CRP [Methylocaldum sp.]HYE35080.1 cAMP-activated global transcriptional regulator CRP [Methylocaldum sp.]
MHALSKLDEALANLLHYCHRRRYPNKTNIIRPGDPGDTLYYIIEGAATVSMTHKPSGEDIVLAYLNKGDFIGEIGVFMGPMPREVTVITREPSLLAEIGYARFSQLLKGELAEHAVGIMNILGRQLSLRLLHTSRKVGSLAFLDVSGRIAHTLIELCQQPEALTHPDGMQIRITRQELGRIVGCSREMAGRVLKNLEEQGLLSAKGKTIVVYGTR